MIKTIKGNLLSVDAGFIVHGCNCVGAMGSGVALAVREKYPGVYTEYARVCAEAERRLCGSLLGTCQFVYVNPQLVVVNAFTQVYPGTDSRKVDYDAVVTCFEEINRFVDAAVNINQTVSFPKIGAGLAGGRWDVISGIIDTVVSEKFQKHLYVI